MENKNVEQVADETKSTKSFKSFWPMVLISALSFLVGGLLVWVAYSQGLDEQLSTLLPGSQRMQRENMEKLLGQADTDTKDWKIYRNEEYGFEFRYPEYLDMSEVKVDSGSLNYNHYVSVNIDTPANILESKKVVSGAGGNLPFLRIGVFSPKDMEMENKACSPIFKSVTLDGVLTNICVNKNIQGTNSDMSIGLVKNNLLYGVNSGAYSGENIKVIDQILSTFKFIYNTSVWKTYKNGQHGFEVKIPQDWLVIDTKANIEFATQKKLDFFQKNLENCKTGKGECIPELGSAEIYFSSKDYSQTDIVQQSYEIVLGQHKWRKYAIPSLGDTFHYQIKQNNTVYDFTTSPYPEDFKIIEQILSTFKFTK